MQSEKKRNKEAILLVKFKSCKREIKKSESD